MNGAASHVVEQDDLHSSSVLHPAAVVFPCCPGRGPGPRPQRRRADPRGGGRLRGRHPHPADSSAVPTTGCSIPLPRSAPSPRQWRWDKLMDFDRERFVDLLGSAGTQAAGLWEFLRDAADSKQLHTAKAAADGRSPPISPPTA
ncbi:hypothetical protein ACPA9J_10845 [Pseudomonas aeruginosa]